MDKSLMEMKEKLCDELTDLVKKRDITVSDLDVIYKAVKSIYYLSTISAMDEYSQGSSMDSYMSGYSHGYSEARRGRDGDSDGRYSERGSYGYSGHDNKEQIIKEMQRMIKQLESK